jgi:thioredoxin reductase (NADPH)
MEKIWDVIIIGAGPAGLTAGMYTARQNHSTLILHNHKIGGHALEAPKIENYPGFPQGLTGAELMKLFHEQVSRFGAEIKYETVIGFSDAGSYKVIATRSGSHLGKTVVFATGIQRKQLRVPGEMEFKGRGVSYCAICDGPFFKNKVVAVVGSGHEAVVDALHLTDTASKVYAIPGLKGYSENFPELVALRSNPKLEIMEGQEITEIIGDKYVTSLKLSGGQVDRLNVDGVFILLEHVSTFDIFVEAGITVDEGGCVILDKNQQTNIPGVYAAGDCTCTGWQVITAAGDGAKAALSAMNYLKQRIDR